MKDICLAAAN